MTRTSQMQREKTWWKKLTRCEKIQSFFIIVAILVVIFISVLLLKKHNIEYREAHKCETKECIVSAANILKNMNPSIDPCENFFEFACGKFTETASIPDDQTYYSAFNSIGNEVNNNYRKIMEEDLKDDEIRPFRLAKKKYRMCMNSTQYETKDLNLFKTMLKEAGGWPVLEGNYWNERNFDWKVTQYNFRKMGLYHDQFIDGYVGVDAKNSTRRIFTIDQAGSGGWAKILKKGLNDTLVKMYRDHNVEMAVLYGADKTTAERDVTETILFQIELAKIIVPSEERRNATAEYHPMKIRELQLKYPSIPWLQFVNMRLEPFASLTYDDIVIVTLPQYIEKVEKVLAATPKRVLANYMFGSVVKYFTEDMRKSRLKFKKVMYGISTDPPLWKQCIYSTGLHLATSSMYVRHFLKQQVKKNVETMIDEVKDVFMEHLRKNWWMDQKTKKRAVAKAEAIKHYVGYPEELFNDDLIREYYEGMTVDEDSLLKTEIATTIFYQNKYLKKFYEPYNKTDWKNKAYPTTVNAFYNQEENSIEIPTGIIHEPFFDSKRPNYLNYGSLGWIIGHEIIHGFDDQGRQYDKEGNLLDWWEPAANETFHEKAKCFIEQYANYTHEKINMTLNGINTQGENIADNGGLKMSYLAYLKSQQKAKKKEPQLPGLNYTPQQLFWISAANTWCEKARPEIEKLQVMNGYHSPQYYRVLVPMINSAHFSKDFHCPIGSPMNPKYGKCHLW